MSVRFFWIPAENLPSLECSECSADLREDSGGYCPDPNGDLVYCRPCMKKLSDDESEDREEDE